MPPFETKRVPRSYVKSHGGDAGSVGTIERGIFKPDVREAVQSLSTDTKHAFEKTKSNSQPLDFVNALAGVAPAVGAAMRPKPNMDYGQYIPFGLTFAQGQQLRDHQLSRATAEEAARQNNEKIELERQRMMGEEASRQQAMQLAEKDFGLRERSMALQERDINARIANTEVMQRIAQSAEKRNQDKFESERPYLDDMARFAALSAKKSVSMMDKQMENIDSEIDARAKNIELGAQQIGLGYARLAQGAAQFSDTMDYQNRALAQQRDIAQQDFDAKAAKMLFDDVDSQRRYAEMRRQDSAKLYSNAATSDDVKRMAGAQALAWWDSIAPKGTEIKGGEIDFSTSDGVSKLLDKAAQKAAEYGPQYAAQFQTTYNKLLDQFTMAKVYGADAEALSNGLASLEIKYQEKQGDKGTLEYYKSIGTPSFGKALNYMRHNAAPIAKVESTDGDVGNPEGTYVGVAKALPKGLEYFQGRKVIVENTLAGQNSIFEAAKNYGKHNIERPFLIGRRTINNDVAIGGVGVVDSSGNWFFQSVDEIKDGQTFMEQFARFSHLAPTSGNLKVDVEPPPIPMPVPMLLNQ